MKNQLFKLKTLAAVACLSAGAASLHATQYVFGYSGGPDGATLTLNTTGGPITVDDSDQGWWSPGNYNDSGNDNWIIGDAGAGGPFNDYFVFDTEDALNGATATSAVLSITDTGDYGGAPYYLSFWDVTTPISVLETNASPNATIYNDLGSGIEYGSLAYGGGSEVVVTLDAAALAAINGANPDFAVGGTITSSAVVASAPDSGTTALLLAVSLAALVAALPLRRQRA